MVFLFLLHRVSTVIYHRFKNVVQCICFVFVSVFARTQIIAISRWCVFNHFCWQRHLPNANKEAKLFNWTQLLVITRSDASCFSLIQHKDHKKLCVRAFCGCCCCCAFALLLFFFSQHRMSTVIRISFYWCHFIFLWMFFLLFIT